MNPQMRAEWLEMVKRATKLRIDSGQVDGRDAIIMELLYHIQAQGKAVDILINMVRKAPKRTVRQVSGLSKN